MFLGQKFLAGSGWNETETTESWKQYSRPENLGFFPVSSDPEYYFRSPSIFGVFPTGSGKIQQFPEAEIFGLLADNINE
jgi:hypothetical protein